MVADLEEARERLRSGEAEASGASAHLLRPFLQVSVFCRRWVEGDVVGDFEEGGNGLIYSPCNRLQGCCRSSFDPDFASDPERGTPGKEVLR